MSKTLLQTILAAFCAILCATSMGGGGMRRRMMVAISIPDYEELAYLESNGNQVIDVGVGFTSNVGGIVCSYAFLNTDRRSAIWGSQTTGDNRWSFNQYEGAGTLFGEMWWIGGTGSLFETRRYINIFYKVDVSANNGTATMIKDDGAPKTTIYANSIADPNNHIALFAVCDGASHYIRQSSVRIAYWNMVQDGTPVRTMKPVLKDGVPCMYDAVTKGFFYNIISGHQFGYCKKDGTIVAPT